MNLSDTHKINELCKSLDHDAYFEATKIAFGHKIPDIKELYHYCSLETFYNIVESNCFWLSHPKFMNDLSEHKYSIETTKKFLQEYNKTIDKNDTSKDLLNLIESNILDYEGKFKGLDEDKYELEFFTCFSSDGDSLPMWSMYRGKDIGLAIGLDFTDEKYFIDNPKQRGEDIQIEKSSPFFRSNSCIFSDITYEEAKIKKAIDIFLEYIRCDYKTKFNSNIQYVNEYLSNRATSTLVNMATNLKNSNFSYEKETRLIVPFYDDKDIKFRVKDKFIVPYIEYPLGKNKQKINKPIIPISSITVSPNAEEPELVIASIRAFLKHKGYNIDKNKIKQSTIPFKPR
jgi:hypothetical protein